MERPDRRAAADFSVALSAGNVAVLKPSELTPLTGLALQKAINAAGRELLFVVTGYGPTGEALVRAGVDKVAFTGSPNTGRRIMAACADSLTPSVMELGGKDPMIVAADANITRAAQAAVGTAFFNSGQACVAAERVLVEGAIYDEFVSETVRITRLLRQGSSPTDHIGPMTQERQMPIIEGRIRAAEAAGARLLAGGHRRPGDGWYFEPTVIADVRPDMELMREETFGPVLCITRVDSLDEAVRIANGSEFGLNGSVFIRDVRRGERIASQLLSGGVNVNDAVGGMAVPAAPFGGEKSSGFGRLQGQGGPAGVQSRQDRVGGAAEPADSHNDGADDDREAAAVSEDDQAGDAAHVRSAVSFTLILRRCATSPAPRAKAP